MTLRPPRRTWPIRVALCVADQVVRTEIADACEEVDITVADPDEPIEDADVVLADRPVETAVPVIALVSGKAREGWPADVRAVVRPDLDAATLAAIITVIAAGYALAPHQDAAGEDTGVWADPGERGDELPFVLTPRERQVLALLAEGASNKAIARALAVSVHTAKFHVASLTEKLGANGRLEAVAIAIRAGLVMV
jgi:DNA-binding CsgD family transcriptional regulator